jgi:MFS family permease
MTQYIPDDSHQTLNGLLDIFDRRQQYQDGVLMGIIIAALAGGGILATILGFLLASPDWKDGAPTLAAIGSICTFIGLIAAANARIRMHSARKKGWAVQNDLGIPERIAPFEDPNSIREYILLTELILLIIAGSWGYIFYLLSPWAKQMFPGF